MQLQILFSNDSAWMNLKASNQDFPVHLSDGQQSIPLYFITDNGKFFAGPEARKWYFNSYADLDQLSEQYFGNLINYLHSGESFDYNGEQQPGAYLVTWLYDFANQYLKENTPFKEIDEIAITGLPDWTSQDLTKLKEQLNLCRPTKIIPLGTFFTQATCVALPVAREFQLGKFEDGQWNKIYSSPAFDADIQIRSMAKRMANNFSLNDQKKQVEILSCEAYLKQEKVLQHLKANDEFNGTYRGVSERGLREISVSFQKNEQCLPDDERNLKAVAKNAQCRLQDLGYRNGTIEFVGDGYCIPEFKRPFQNSLDAYILQFTTTHDFLQRIFKQEWSASTQTSVPVLNLSSLQPGDVVNLHGADNGKPDSFKKLRFLGQASFEIISNNRWGKVGEKIQALENSWAVGQKIHFQAPEGKVTTRTLKEIQAPVKSAPSHQPPQKTDLSSAFEVNDSAKTEKNIPLDSIDCAKLNTGDIVSLHGIDPTGKKAPSRMDLRYLGKNRFETLENTRGWSKPGDVIEAVNAMWNLNQKLQFKMVSSGKVATTRLIDSLQVK